MLLKYGSYSFPVETTVALISNNVSYDAQGRADKQTSIWRVRTELYATTQNAITSAINTLEAALVDGNTLTLFQNDGSTPTPHLILSCKISSFGYPQGTGPEYGNRRTVEIVFTSDTSFSKADDLRTFSETFSFSGGGPRSILQETIEGEPQKNQVAQNTKYLCTQRGAAAGKDQYPSPPGPAFPGHEIQGKPTVQYSPTRDAEGEILYSITWEYNFESATELVGLPNIWL